MSYSHERQECANEDAAKSLVEVGPKREHCRGMSLPSARGKCCIYIAPARGPDASAAVSSSYRTQRIRPRNLERGHRTLPRCCRPPTSSTHVKRAHIAVFKAGTLLTGHEVDCSGVKPNGRSTSICSQWSRRSSQARMVKFRSQHIPRNQQYTVDA